MKCRITGAIDKVEGVYATGVAPASIDVTRKRKIMLILRFSPEIE